MANVLDRNFDFLTNGTVTAAGLHNLIDETNIYAGLISTQEAKTTVGTGDLLLIADSSSIGSPQIAANRVTVQKLFSDTLTNGTFTGLGLNLTNATITNGTVTTLNSTTGTIPTLVATTIITTGTGTAAAPAIVPTGDTNTGIFFPAADTIAFAEGGAEAMRIDSSGNVLVGTTSVGPLGASGRGLLEVNGSTDSAIALKRGNTAGLYLYTGSGEGRVGQVENLPLTFFTNNTERLRIDSSGNVGIGNTVASTIISAAGGSNGLVVGTGSGTPNLVLYGGTSNYGGLYFADGTTSGDTFRGYVEYNHASNFLRLGTNANEGMRIDSSGNVGIGTTPSTKLHILGAAQTSGGIRIQETTNNAYRTLYINTGGGLYFYNGTNEGYLSSGGAWTNASDARLKKNITDIKYGLSSVMEAKPRSFERVDVDGEYFGFVAQELQEVFPEAVSGDPERQLGVDYGSLVAVAFRAIQELKSENDSLKSRIEALEAA